MIERKVRFVIKFGNREYIDRLFYHGEMFFNTVDFFNKKDSNQQRFDKNEGALEIDQVKWLKIRSQEGKILEFSKTDPKLIKLSSAYKLTSDDSPKGNIYSCSGVTTETLKSFQKLNPAFSDFGDAVILIENPNAFFSRVEDELRRRNFNFQIGFVNYYNTDEKNGSLSVFDKTDKLSYQNEIRIWIKNDKHEPIKTQIGSIEDISCKFLISGILKEQTV